MYKRFVRAKVRSTFESINDGDYLPMVDGLAPTFEYRFHGDHALGGHRTSRAAMVRWWERVLRLMPGVRFSIDDILVNGGPWRTRVAVRSHVSGPLPGDEHYANTVFQFISLRWGKVTSVETLEDLQVLQRALHAVATAGDSEALADPIED
ncbi:nuclear transport factor 2 family protein [Ruania zhangjianzhongii]|uniref:nuclear transport factor 2 family protein n=1 Tax=Ruania zhangjianzhongii TaxID=2603206 RepID=UPI0011CC2EFD|nr:nuclear transport factor 2 family protein [Ruania zhangjianzhongii]